MVLHIIPYKVEVFGAADLTWVLLDDAGALQ